MRRRHFHGKCRAIRAQMDCVVPEIQRCGVVIADDVWDYSVLERNGNSWSETLPSGCLKRRLMLSAQRQRLQLERNKHWLGNAQTDNTDAKNDISHLTITIQVIMWKKFFEIMANALWYSHWKRVLTVIVYAYFRNSYSQNVSWEPPEKKPLVSTSSFWVDPLVISNLFDFLL